MRVSSGQHGVHVDPPLGVLLFPAGGDPVAAERLVAWSVDGGHAVLVREDQLVLFAARDRSLTVLEGGLAVPRVRTAARAADFDPSGRRLVFMRGEPPELVVRGLRSGAERVLPHGEGRLFRVAFASGSWIAVDVQIDGDGDGAITPFEVAGSRPTGDCAGAAMTSSVSGSTGDLPVRRLVSTETGDVVEQPLASCGRVAAYRGPGEEVLLAVGRRVDRVAPPGCEVLGCGSRPGAAVGYCHRDTHAVPVELFRARGRTEVGLSVAAGSEAGLAAPDVLRFYDFDATTRLLDANSGAHLAAGGHLLGQRGGRAIVGDRGVAWTVSWSTGARSAWPLGAPVLEQGRWIALQRGPFTRVHHKWRRTLLGEVIGEAHALSVGGHVLVATGPGRWEEQGVADGPFQWIDPRQEPPLRYEPEPLSEE